MPDSINLGTIGIEAGINARIIFMDIFADTKTGSNKLAVAICSELYLVIHPPKETKNPF